MTEKTYNFGEKSKENYKTKEGWVELEVWQTPKFVISRTKAIELIESKKYGLDEGDFWILKNQGGKKLCYTGLIISHNGCLKINDKLEPELKFKPSSVSFVKDTGNKEKVLSYINEEQGVYEFGEISADNCKNDYPYAMVLKRLMDRVILKNSKVGFFGIYSEAESDDFKDNPEPKEEVKEKSAKNVFNLSKDGDLASNADMIETQKKMNEDDFAGLKAIIENCGGIEELQTIWADKKNVAIVNKLKKYELNLHDLLIQAKDTMKAELTGVKNNHNA